MTEIKVIYRTDTDAASDIRALFCRESGRRNENPLMKTNFNELLDKVAQDAFDAGRKFKFPNGGAE